MPGETSMLKALLLAVGSFFGHKKAQLEANNTPEMRAGEKSAQDASATDAARKAVAAGDEDAIRRGLS